jgi:hypothetical protein
VDLQTVLILIPDAGASASLGIDAFARLKPALLTT